jgi:hypothetical protein
MYIHHIRKTTLGGGGSGSRNCSCGGKAVVKNHKRIIGNGLTNAVFDTDLGIVKPTKLLQNIRVKKQSLPKKYITFE